jgi:hypothetical protein
MFPTAVQVDTSDEFFVMRTLSAPGAGVTHAVNRSKTADATIELKIMRISNSNQ